jgi:hypothetical protein
MNHFNDRSDLTEEEKKYISEQTDTLRQFFIYELIKQLIPRKLICISYTKNNKSVRKYFELKGNSLDFYSDQEKRITLYSIVEDKEETIFFKDITCYVMPSQPNESLDKDVVFKHLQKHKLVYNFLKQKIQNRNVDYNLDDAFFDSQLHTLADLPFLICLRIQDLNEFYSPTPEQFAQHKQTLLSVLEKECANQKQIIKKEFEIIQKENSLADEELNSLISFIDDTEKTTTFEDCKTIFEMFDKWPPIFTSPVATWMHNNPLN